MMKDKLQRVRLAVVVACVLTVVLNSGAETRAEVNLLDAMPNDAVGVLVVDYPQRAMPPTLMEPVVQALASEPSDSKAIMSAIKQFPGGFAVGFVKSKRDNLPPVIIAAMDLSRPGVDFDAWLNKKVVPAFAAISPDLGDYKIRLEKSKDVTRFVRKSDDKMLFAVAVKNKVAFGSNKPQLVLQWRKGDFPEKRWTGLPGARRLIRQMGKEKPAARVLLGPLSEHVIVPRTKSGSSLQTLAMDLLSPDDILAAAVDLNWDRRGLSISVGAALAEECKGIASVLARTPTESQCLGVFPEDFQILARVGWSSAQGVFDELFRLTDTFDETISKEYRAEMAEFRKETGAEWDTAILGNMVHEAVIGVRVDLSKPKPFGWAVAFPLRDEALFKREFNDLISHFELPFEESQVGGVLIRKAVGTAPFHIAVAHGLLLVGDGEETLSAIAKRAGGKSSGKPAAKTLRKCYDALGERNQAALILDIEQLRKGAPIIAMVAGPMAPFLLEGSAGAAMTMENRVVRLDIKWDMVGAGTSRKKTHSEALGGADVIAMAGRMFAASMAKAKEHAKRIASVTQMRRIGMAMYKYAEGHNGAFPDSLETLLKASPDGLTLQSFKNPYSNTGPTSIIELKDCYLIYRPGLTTSSAPDQAVLAEREVGNRGGAGFLFVDGHVEWIAEPRASELIALIREDAESVRH